MFSKNRRKCRVGVRISLVVNINLLIAVLYLWEENYVAKEKIVQEETEVSREKGRYNALRNVE